MLEKQILNALQKTKDDEIPVRLLNVFKGVPVHCKAAVRKVSDENVILVADAPESICLVWNANLWMEVDDLQQVVTARVNTFDLVSGELQLSELQFGESVLGERMWVRVEPKNPIKVEIILHNQQINGNLADLSTIGAGIYVYAGESTRALEVGSRVEISARLPVGAIRMHGSVGNLTRSVDYHRISIGFDSNQPDEQLIRNYIAQREEEINTEIVRMYETLLHSRLGDRELPV